MNESKLNIFSYQERQEAMLKALEKLSEEEALIVRSAAKDLVSAVKAKNVRIPFSEEAALETLAAIGLLISRKSL